MPVINLPSLNNETLLSADLTDDFRKNGHVHIKGLLSTNEVEAFRNVINAAAYKFNTEHRKMEDRDTYGKAFLQVMNLWEQDELVRLFTLSRRFAKMAADLLGVENVRIYHDQALYKEAGGGHTPWHQDQYYWPLDTSNTVTLWMPLIPIDEKMGMLTFASGSHKNGAFENIAISDESDTLLDNYVKEKNYPVSCPSFMEAGDASFHYGWTLHKAPANQSAHTREVMTIIYFADGATVTTPINQHQENDRLRWLEGIEPGQPAASSINPLIR